MIWNSLNENRAVDYRCNSFWAPCQNRKWFFLGDLHLFWTNSGGFRSSGVTLWSRNNLLSPENLTQDHLTTIHKVWMFLSILAALWGWGVTLWSGNLLLSPKTLIMIVFMKVEWLITNVTAGEAPSEQNMIFGAFFDIFLAKLGCFYGQVTRSKIHLDGFTQYFYMWMFSKLMDDTSDK